MLGRKVYNFRCYFCHGYSGNAKTLASSFLSPPPRDFTATALSVLSREQMVEAVAHGRPRSAMMGFKHILSEREIVAVVNFVRVEFMAGAKPNARYHSPENGWSNDEGQSAAYPFATGQISLDTPWEELSPKQQMGKRIFMASCVTCHDRAAVRDEGKIWETRPLSYPRNNYSHKASKTDAISGASVYALHDVAPKIVGMNDQERMGEQLFQGNCEFCHAADGTGRNWIGSFLDAHPRNLTSKEVFSLGKEGLRKVILNGLPGTTMPAWKTVLTSQQVEAIIAYINRAFISQNRTNFTSSQQGVE